MPELLNSKRHCRIARLSINHAHRPTNNAKTCTFVTAKPGFLVPAALPYVGRLHVLDIGQPRGLVEMISASRKNLPV